MAKRDFAFGKENFILIAVAVAVIIIGFMFIIYNTTYQHPYGGTCLQPTR